jgi:hypothetical protein
MVLVAAGVAFIAFNKRWARWVYTKTQHPLYSIVSSIASKHRYNKLCIIVNRGGLIFWGAVLITAGCINLLS